MTDPEQISRASATDDFKLASRPKTPWQSKLIRPDWLTIRTQIECGNIQTGVSKRNLGLEIHLVFDKEPSSNFKSLGRDSDQERYVDTSGVFLGKHQVILVFHLLINFLSQERSFFVTKLSFACALEHFYGAKSISVVKFIHHDSFMSYGIL